MTFRVAAVIPARNEAEHIAQVVRGLWDYPEVVRVLVVDDGSTDLTAEEALKAGAHVFRMAVPHDSIAGGKGAAIREGLALLKAESFDYYLFLDGDGQHDPQDFKRFLEALARCPASDVLLGTRTDEAALIPRKRWLTNQLGSWLLSRISGVRWTDSQCGFRMIRKTLLDRMPLCSKGFEIEVEMLFGAARHALTWTPVPIKAIYHSGCPSHFKGVKDVLRIMIFSVWC